MGTFLQDLRHAFRMLRRSPGFTTVAALTLALGIGINTTIFSGISALLLRPLPYANAERLVDFRPGGPNSATSKAMLVELRERLRSFDAIASYNSWTFTWMADSGAEQIAAVRATGDLFNVLGANPLLGRALIPADSVPGAERVVVLSYDFWQRRLGGDPAVAGRVLQLNEGAGLGGPTQVIGVMPPDFAFPTATAEMWAPTSLDPAAPDYNNTYLELLARLAPDADIDTATREATATFAALCDERADFGSGASCNERNRATARVVPLRAALVGSVRPILLLLLGAVGFVLLIACANVANLLLARVAARERELAIRTALGAGRGRVTRQFLTESLAIAAVGGVLGILVAVWGSGLLRAALPPGLVGAADIRVDVRVLAFAAAAVLLAAVMVGLFPAISATGTNPNEVLANRGSVGLQACAAARAGHARRRRIRARAGPHGWRGTHDP